MTKCIDCNAPVVRTVDGTFVCVDCGSAPIQTHDDAAPPATDPLEIPVTESGDSRRSNPMPTR